MHKIYITNYVCKLYILKGYIINCIYKNIFKKEGN